MQHDARWANGLEIRADFLDAMASGNSLTKTEARLPRRRTRAWSEGHVRHAIAAARKAGLRNYRVEITPEGSIAIVVTG